MRSTNFALLGAALAVSLSTLPASAHHGWGGQATSFSDMTGTVVQGVSLAGPHATMKVNVEGKVWDITLAPPFRTREAGLADGTIPVGATVTVHGNKNLNPNRLEMKTVQVRWGDKKFDVYPVRE
jgi:hypothetical protein